MSFFSLFLNKFVYPLVSATVFGVSLHLLSRYIKPFDLKDGSNNCKNNDEEKDVVLPTFKGTEAKRKRIAEEILSTEETYVVSLKTLIDVFLLPIRENIGKKKEEILTASQSLELFSIVEVISHYHEQDLFPNIKKKLSNWSESQCLGDVFLANTDFMKHYSKYVNNFDDALELYDSLIKSKNSNFVNFLKKAVTDARITLPLLTAYLIMPVQRIPRYVMLLSDLLKNTPENHPDYVSLSSALQKMEELALAINEAKRSEEESQKVSDMIECIPGLKLSANENRRLIGEIDAHCVLRVHEDNNDKDVLEGILYKLTDNTKKWKPRWFVLKGNHISYYSPRSKSKGSSTGTKLGTLKICVDGKRDDSYDDERWISSVRIVDQQLELTMANGKHYHLAFSPMSSTTSSNNSNLATFGDDDDNISMASFSFDPSSNPDLYSWCARIQKVLTGNFLPSRRKAVLQGSYINEKDLKELSTKRYLFFCNDCLIVTKKGASSSFSSPLSNRKAGSSPGIHKRKSIGKGKGSFNSSTYKCLSLMDFGGNNTKIIDDPCLSGHPNAIVITTPSQQTIIAFNSLSEKEEILNSLKEAIIVQTMAFRAKTRRAAK